MYDTGYFSTGYHATGYYMRGAVEEVDEQNYTFARFYEGRIHREDEEILLIARAFIEIIRWH